MNISKSENSGFVGFITATEVVALKGLENQLARLEEHSLSLSPPADLKNEFKALRDRYRDDPTDKNLAACRDVLVARELSVTVTPRLKDVIFVAEEHFALAKVLPLVLPILDRLLNSANSDLAEVTEAENTRHIAEFGTPVQNSKLLSAAQQEVSRIQSMRSVIQGDKLAFSAVRPLIEFLNTVPVRED